MKILIVDDNKACVQVMVWTLEVLGYNEVQVAYDGPTAIELAKSFRPELVLLDIGMPEMNGYDTCRAMRKEPMLRDTVFVAHTGWGEKIHRKHSEEAGFAYHLVKPVDIEILKRVLFKVDKSRSPSQELKVVV